MARSKVHLFLNPPEFVPDGEAALELAKTCADFAAKFVTGHVVMWTSSYLHATVYVNKMAEAGVRVFYEMHALVGDECRTILIGHKKGTEELPFALSFSRALSEIPRVLHGAFGPSTLHPILAAFAKAQQEGERQCMVFPFSRDGEGMFIARLLGLDAVGIERKITLSRVAALKLRQERLPFDGGTAPWAPASVTPEVESPQATLEF